MLKILSWVSLGLTILGAVSGLSGADGSGPETAAEVSLLVQTLGVGPGQPEGGHQGGPKR